MNSPDGAQLVAGMGLVAMSLIPMGLVPDRSSWWESMPPLIFSCFVFIVGCYLVIGAFL